MVQLTEKAIGKVKEIMSSQEPKPVGLRIAVVGGGIGTILVVLAAAKIWPEMRQLRTLDVKSVQPEKTTA